MRIIRFLLSRFTRFRRLQLLHADQIMENNRLHLQILELQEEVATLESEAAYHARQSVAFERRYKNAIGEGHE